MKIRTSGWLVAAAGLALAFSQSSCTGDTSVAQTTPMPEKQFLNDEGAKPNGYTHVVTSPPGKMIFLSGAGGSAADGTMPSDFATQAENTFQALERRLQAAGATFADVVKINYFLRNMEDLTVLREVRSRYLNMEQPPAATAVEAGLSGEMLLEVEAIAIVPE